MGFEQRMSQTLVPLRGGRHTHGLSYPDECTECPQLDDWCPLCHDTGIVQRWHCYMCGEECWANGGQPVNQVWLQETDERLCPDCLAEAQINLLIEVLKPLAQWASEVAEGWDDNRLRKLASEGARALRLVGEG